VHLFETDTGRPLGTLEGHEDYVQAIAISGDGRLLASGGRDRSIRLWSIR
jgi:WD40 repeat protein